MVLEPQLGMLEQQAQQAAGKAARSAETLAAVERERDQLACEVAQLQLATEAAQLTSDAEKKVRGSRLEKNARSKSASIGQNLRGGAEGEGGRVRVSVRLGTRCRAG
jgi:hypothetical protein